MSILNPTPQEIEDDKSPLYSKPPKAEKPAKEAPVDGLRQHGFLGEAKEVTKTKLDDIVDKHIAEAVSTVMQNQIEAEKYSTKQHSGKIFIVAGNRAEYTAWVDRNGYKYTETQYVQNAQSLKGLENIKGFYIGTYASRHDIQDIMSVIATSKRFQKIITTGLSEHTYGGTIGVDGTWGGTIGVDGTWGGTTTYIGGTGAGGTMSSSVGSVAAISYEQMRAQIQDEIREKLHDAFEATTYPDATIKFIISVIDKELDKF